MIQDSFNPFFYVLIVITPSTYTYIAIYFINKAKTKIPEWSRQHIVAFIFSMADTRTRKEKAWRNVGVRDEAAIAFAMRMQVCCLFLGFSGASLIFLATARFFTWQHWI
ncbi:hypothetical protein [Xanthobacter sp. 91]|uniref:hypothetical protein n=1 Tax=Xanthobacter sp. 91 TaxID=1117244 RepID=UPI0012DEAE69|nr:hypothetical protein [Xanthobacter sp. 91]